MGSSLILIISINIALVLGSSDEQLVCGENETVDTCPGSCSDFCPQSEDDDICSLSNQTPDTCGTPVCRCRFNYKRDIDNGTCIPTRDCPPFDCSARPYEEYNSCPPFCTDNCSQASPSGTCRTIGRIGIVLECNPKCRCINGYWRENGICVPYADCPGICPENEEFSNCVQTLCRGDNCTQKGQIIECPLILEESCQQGCVCIAGTLRTDNGSCIPEDQCPELPCGDNETLNECPSVCNTDACPTNLTIEEQPCIKICGPPICECISNYKRDENGNCIPIEDCPGICSANEEYSSCTQAICRAQNCTQIGQPIACPRIAEGFCQQGCVCVEGSLRNKNGNCVPIDQCEDNLICGEYEELNECTSVCYTDACPINLNSNNNAEVCITLCGPPKCECIQNYKRGDDGYCIPIEECPGICPDNEEYSSCTQALCRAQNCTQIGQPIACPSIAEGFCQQGCVCVEGSLRDKNGNCVPIDQCEDNLICGEYEELNECTSVCYTDACPINLNSNNNAEVCITLCGPPKCECIENYKRGDDGYCIPIEECPGICLDNEEYSSCTQALCRAQNCTQIGQPIACPAIVDGYCQEGCVCIQGTLRDENGYCVPEEQCPEQIPGENEEFNECTNICNTDACPKKKNYENAEPCILICGPPKCECIHNYKRDDTGDCISIEDCPSCRAQSCTQKVQSTACPAVPKGICQGYLCVEGTLKNEDGICIEQQQCNAPNEVASCVRVCPPEKTCRNRDIHFNCLDDKKDCQQKCICKEGYFRNSNNECISENECNQCQGKNEFFSCGSACDNVCKDLATQNRTNCPIINIQCNRKCYCDDGFARDDFNNCVPIDKCPNKENNCADNEEFYNCKRTCPPDSCLSLVAKFKCPENPICEPGCVCKPGFLRKDTICVPICDCTELKNSEDCKKSNKSVK